MLPDPMHPIVVHFPVVLSVVLPIVAISALWAIRGGARSHRAWGVTIAVAAALILSAWMAVETGEQQEERVEKVVGEARLDAHASAGETLLFTSVGVLVVLALGLMPGDKGRVARYAGTAGTLAVAAMAFRVGMTGGDLVYKHNAASAYTASGAGDAGGEKGAVAEKEGGKGQDDDERGDKDRR